MTAQISKRPAQAAEKNAPPNAAEAKAPPRGRAPAGDAATQAASDPQAQEGDATDPEIRYRMIREAAFARYMQRGCVDGFDFEDWLTAEADVDRVLRKRNADSESA